MHRTILTALALGLLAGIAQAGGVEGSYAVRGTGFDGAPYTGTAQIEMTSSRTCRIAWQTGGAAKGLCMIDGDRVIASYEFDGGAGMGLVSYELLKDGSLDGVWTADGVEGLGTEVLTPQR